MATVSCLVTILVSFCEFFMELLQNVFIVLLTETLGQNFEVHSSIEIERIVNIILTIRSKYHGTTLLRFQCLLQIL